MSTDLARFRVDSKPEGALDPLPFLDVAFIGKVVAVDQSLSSSGWVVLSNYGHGLTIHATGTFKSSGDLKGHDRTLARASDLYSAYAWLLRRELPNVVVYETPPVANRVSRPESSLLAAHSLRLAAILEAPQAVLVMRSAQQAKKRWTGQSNADKKFVKEALEVLLRVHDIVLPKGHWNADVVDALSIGLKAMEEKDLDGG